MNSISTKKICLALAALVSLAQPLAAQTYPSPYSRFGLGTRYSQDVALIQGMGNAGVAYSHNNRYTLSNPASFASVYSMVLETSFAGGGYRATSSEQVNQGPFFNLQYLTLGFKVGMADTATVAGVQRKGGKGGLGFGLVPHTTSNYNLASTRLSAGNTPYREILQGSGGTNRAFMTFAWDFNGIKAGISGSYIFGNVQNVQRIEFGDTMGFLGLQFNNNQIVSGALAEAGLLYDRIRIGNVGLTVGAAATVPAFMNVRQRRSAFTYRTQFPGFPFDSVMGVRTAEQTLEQSVEFRAGLALKKGEAWNTGVQLSYMPASTTQQAVPLQDEYILAIGGGFRPTRGSKDIHGIGRYLGATQYSFGLRGGNLAFPEGIDASFMAATFGASFPLRHLVRSWMVGPNPYDAWSYINVSVEAGMLGSASRTSVREEYVRLVFGFHLYEPSWLRQRRID